ncbi:hypothetical protein ES703_17575 [subsurface metagenome]
MPKANVNNIEIEYETIGEPISKPFHIAKFCRNVQNTY